MFGITALSDVITKKIDLDLKLDQKEYSSISKHGYKVETDKLDNWVHFIHPEQKSPRSTPVKKITAKPIYRKYHIVLVDDQNRLKELDAVVEILATAHIPFKIINNLPVNKQKGKDICIYAFKCLHVVQAELDVVFDKINAKLNEINPQRVVKLATENEDERRDTHKRGKWITWRPAHIDSQTYKKYLKLPETKQQLDDSKSEVQSTLQYTSTLKMKMGLSLVESNESAAAAAVLKIYIRQNTSPVHVAEESFNLTVHSSPAVSSDTPHSGADELVSRMVSYETPTSVMTDYQDTEATPKTTVAPRYSGKSVTE